MNEESVTVRVKEIIDEFEITDEQDINLFGRIVKGTDSILVSNTASGFEVCMKGSELKADISYVGGISPCPYLRIFVDGDKEGFETV